MPPSDGLQSPADVRAIFGQNLRILCAGQPPVAELCRRIGINRTQFNRYLAGEAFPRPDVLQRICSHFGVDARILLEPIAGIRSDWRSRLAAGLRDVVVPPDPRPFDHYLMPDGFYRYWRRSFTAPGSYVIGMWLAKTRGGVKTVRSYDIYPHPVRRGHGRFARKIPYSGIVMQHFDGVSLLCSTGTDNVLSFTFLEYGLNGATRYFNGITMLTRRRMPDMGRLSNIVLARLPPHRDEVLACARQCGIVDGDLIPPDIRRVLDRPSDDR